MNKQMASRTKGKTTMEVGADGVAVITLINPPVNSLSFDGTQLFTFSDLFSISPFDSESCENWGYDWFDLRLS